MHTHTILAKHRPHPHSIITGSMIGLVTQPVGHRFYAVPVQRRAWFVLRDFNVLIHDHKELPSVSFPISRMQYSQRLWDWKFWHDIVTSACDSIDRKIEVRVRRIAQQLASSWNFFESCLAIWRSVFEDWLMESLRVWKNRSYSPIKDLN